MRRIKDVNDTRTINLPADGATAYTESIDLGTGPHVERLEGLFTIGATPTLGDAKTVVCSLEDSDDNVTFTAVAPAISKTLTGAGGAGAAAATLEFRFPPTIRRYIRGKAVTEAAAGTVTNAEFELAILG